MKKNKAVYTQSHHLPLRGKWFTAVMTLLLLLLSVYASPLLAQGRILGRVSDLNKSPLAGASIDCNGKVTATDSQGHYTTSDLVDGHARLTCSYTGYKTLDTIIAVSGRTTLNITLRPLTMELEEVVVYDNPLARERRNTPVSTQTVDEDFIRQNMGGSLMQTLEKLGGVNSIAIGSGQSKPIIRGLGFNRVVVAESGIKHEGQQWGADHGLEIDQYAVGSVKLIKGPQSLMYGSDAIGGVIEIEKPKAPLEDTSGGALDLTYKTNNNLYGSSLNFFSRKKSLYFDARMTSLDYADYKVPVDHVKIYSYKAPLYKHRLRNTAGNELNLHLTTGYIAEKFSSVFHISNLKSKSGLFANAHGLEPRNVDTELHDATDRDIQNPYQDVSHFKVINRTRFQLSGHKVEAELGYQNNFRQEFSDYIPHGFMPPNYPSDLPIDEELEREFIKSTYALNVKDNFTIGDHQLVIGATAEHQNNNIGGWGFVIPSFRQSSAGAFILDKLQLGTRWILHLGVRYDYGRIATEDYYDWFTSPLNGAETYLQRAVALTREFSSPSWSLGVNYNRDYLFLRANLGRSFRMPIAKELASNGVNYHQFSYERGDAGLSPEKAYQLDLGLTYDKGGLFADVSPFLNYFSNYIYLNPTPDYDYAYGAGNQIFNYTQSRVFRYGGEARINYIFLQKYTLGMTGEFVYSEQLSGAKKGYTLPFSPAPSVLFNFTYTTPVSQDIKSISAGIDYKVLGAQNTIVPPENKTPGYNVINLFCNAAIRLNKQELQISLQAQNLLNSANLNHTSFYRIIGVPEPGRNIIVSAKLPFSI